MKYSALVFDLDGTAVPSRMDGVPSKNVVDAVFKARELVKISVATGRPWNYCKEIVKTLKIVSPCIVNGGTQVVDPISGAPIWEQFLTSHQASEVLNIAKEFNANGSFDDSDDSNPLSEYKITGTEKIFFFVRTDESTRDLIIKKLEKIEDIVFSQVPSWGHGWDVHVTHKLGTKKHALEKLIEMEKINPQTLMVVGDGNNDLPLFEKAGFKVAMGNASEKLKAAADFVTTTVDEDGLANAIEKYILVS